MSRLNTKLIAASLLACGLASGCGNANKKTAAAKQSAVPPMNQAALDVPASPPATPAAPAAPPVAYTPTPPQQPVVYDPATEQQPVVEEPMADAWEPAPAPAPVTRTRPRKTSASVASAGAGRTKYKVKKGESLWSIAETRYGNGHKWKAIAAANPKIDPNRVQAGQTITLP